MPNCKLCSNAATVSAEIVDPKTGNPAGRVYLCDSCLAKVSGKVRNIVAVNQANRADAGNTPKTVLPETAEKDPEPIYMQNLAKLSKFLFVFFCIGFTVSLIGGVLFLSGLAGRKEAFELIPSISATVCGIALIFNSYVPMLLIEALEDYLKSGKK